MEREEIRGRASCVLQYTGKYRGQIFYRRFRYDDDGNKIMWSMRRDYKHVYDGGWIYYEDVNPHKPKSQWVNKWR